MSAIHSYSKIFNLGHPEVSTLFNGEVVVQEKIDGSQFSFMKDADGQLHFRSKGAEIHEGTTDKLFSPAVEAILARRELLEPGYVYRGEALCRPKHNTLEYKRVPRGNVIIYDVDTGEQNYISDPVNLAAAIDLEAVREFFRGLIKSADEVKALLNRESILGGDIEGVVIKNYREFGRDKKVLMGKYVRDEFKEQHKVSWGESNPSRNDVVERIGTSLRTDARFRKAVERLRDAGRLTGTPKDIGPLMKELGIDLNTEARPVVAEELVNHFWKDIQRKATAGFAEWYKEQLLQQQFAEAPAVSTTTSA
jgi:hypothetical protein